VALEEGKLVELRQRLLVELEALRSERTAIDIRLSEELKTLRVAPVELRDHHSWTHEVSETRTRNSKLKIRIKDLMGYVEKLELQNRRLEEERRVIQTSELHRRQTGDDWRIKINALQREHLSYETELREKMRVKEEQSLRSIRTQ
jgi:hypothetical protein